MRTRNKSNEFVVNGENQSLNVMPSNDKLLEADYNGGEDKENNIMTNE